MMLFKVEPQERRTQKAYIIRRLLSVVPMWFALSVFVFMTSRCIGISAINMIETYPSGTDQTYIAMDLVNPWVSWLGLDQPVHMHYLRWMGLMKQEDGQYHGVLEGDLGQSLWEYTRRP
jgi:ABC-type dipeptide/oligopeptide/nickel transport system permease component